MFKLQSKITLFTTGQMDYESVWVQFLLTPPTYKQFTRQQDSREFLSQN